MMGKKSQDDRGKGVADPIGDREGVSALQFSGESSFSTKAKDMSFSTIKKLTDNFSSKNMIGEGFAGKVYKATLPSGQIVAIKRIKMRYRKGAREFKREFDVLSGLHHANLVRLVGVCCDQFEQMIISEFVPNGNLYDALHGKTGIHLSWTDRLRIALETARGLAHLHESAEPPIVHGNVRSSNILLDTSLRPRVSDYGLVRQSWAIYLLTGTYGFLHPGRPDTLEPTHKWDVLSFGVVMLELLTGRTPRSMLAHARLRLSGRPEDIVDPVIYSPILPGLERFVDLVLRCVEDLSVDRPAMREVAEELESIFENINLDSRKSSDNGNTAERDGMVANPFEDWETDAGTAPHLNGVSSFSLTDIKKFTADFFVGNKIGVGGYGEVYKGKLSTGQFVAIKKASKDSMQGAREFKNEIELLSRVHHVNLVRLVGFCYERGEQILVYELVANGTLADSLYGKNKIWLSWIDRLRIALGTASGLAYLHEHADPSIIHRDVKADNILLDESYVPKVADFGISTLAEKDWTTNVKGTFGYLDPEYCSTHRVSDKIDVYSFGVVMLVLLTARKPIENDEHISTKVRAALESSVGVRKIVDPTIQDAMILCGAATFAELALRCVDRKYANRPSMRVVVKEIESILDEVLRLRGASSSSSQVHTGPY